MTQDLYLTNEPSLKDSKRLWRTINRHLDEEHCNHSLRDIVKEALD